MAKTQHQRNSRSIARIEALRVENYRALKKVEIKDITPLTALLGPNGSGKSTLFDVFAFLKECFDEGLRRAWDRRGRMKELRTRGAEGPVVIELKYREAEREPVITYHLAITESNGNPCVSEEWLQWRRGSWGRPFRFIEFKNGTGKAASGDKPDETDTRDETQLQSPDILAVNALGQFTSHPRVAALRNFIMGWHVSYLTISETRQQPIAGPQERLSRTGDNLPNVIQYLREQHPDRLESIYETMQRRIPRLERVLSEVMPDNRLLLQIKDAPFDKPVLSNFASDGTLKMLAYLTLLYDPSPPQFIGIEEPENYLHPKLLPELAEECRNASAHSQVLVTTHSPFFLNALRPNEVRVLYRDEQGYTQIEHASSIQGIPEFVQEGALLGSLWSEGHFGVGDPLTRQGMPGKRKRNIKG